MNVTRTETTYDNETKLRFQPHDGESMFRLVTQRKMLQSKITMYYQRKHCARKEEGATKKGSSSWSDSSDDEEGIRLVVFRKLFRSIMFQ